MWAVIPIGFLALMIWVVVWPRGFDPGVVAIAVISTALVTWASYLESKRYRQAPTRTETVLATAWLWFRRLVCYAAALAFLCFAVVAALYSAFGPADRDILSSLLASCAMIGLSGVAVYVGRIGSQGYGSHPRQDMANHEQLERRYQWKGK